MALRRGEEHDTRNSIRVYKDTMHKDSMEFGDNCARAQPQQELNIAERVAAYSSGDMDMVARIDEREERRRKWKSYDRSVHKNCADISRVQSAKGNSSS